MSVKPRHWIRRCHYAARRTPADNPIHAIVTAGLVLIAVSASGGTPESVCHGTTARGSLEHGRRIPTSGENFQAYSLFGVALGRTYVHSRVLRTILSTYAKLESASPGTVFVYGETGFKRGGSFRPHKTHQNGLSVDHMVPVLDETGRSVPLPCGVFNKLGYSIEFDEAGRYENLVIDYEALSEFLFQLHQSSLEEGIEIWRVIFDPELQPYLHETRRWSYLREHVQFSKKRSWVRHDEHIHIDFRVPCSS